MRDLDGVAYPREPRRAKRIEDVDSSALGLVPQGETHSARGFP